jgi:ankyrin repeat protein
MYGVVSHNLELVNLLLDHGADVEAHDPDGITSLMAASGGGFTGIVKALLDHGANANDKSTDGTTALKLALQFNHSDVVDLLRAKGAQ